MSIDTHNRGLSAEELELLAYLMEEEGLDVATRQTIFPRTQQTNIPLSFAQQRLWFLDQWQPGTAAYNVPFALRLLGRLNISALHRALNAIVERHEALRTTFATVDGRPIQVIAPVDSAGGSVPLPQDDLSHLPQAEREAEALRQALEEANTGFDLARGPLMRARLLRLAADEHVFMLNMHHIISDGWSSALFQREMITLYEAFDREHPAALPELPIQYADFAIWQRNWLQGAVLEEQLDYWRQKLDGLSTLDLPTDRPRPPVQSYRGSHERFTIAPEYTTALESVGKRHGATLFMTLLAAFDILLHRYSGQTDIVVGSPIANRDLVEVEPLIGFFVNTLILRADLAGNPRFTDLLVQVRDTTLAASAHQNVPFEQLVEVLRPERDPSRPPLFQVMFVLQNMPLAMKELPDLKIEPLRADPGVSKFDLMLSLAETPSGLRGNLEYSTDLFDQTTIQRMIEHFLVLLEQISAAPDQPIGALSILTPAERHELLVAWNQAAAPAADMAIHQVFAAQAARTPQAIAVVHGDRRLTYAELDARANQLAHALQARGVGPESLVALCLERSTELIIALLAVLKAGGAYVPLDPALPYERLQFILADTRAPLLLTQHAVAVAWPNGPIGSTEVICLDREADAIDQQPRTEPTAAVAPDHPAYVIYTSGSTGQPKGVMIPHRALAAYTAAAQEAYAITANDRVLQFASISFDASAEEIYSTLTCGATLVLRTDEMLASAAAFFRTCQSWNLSVISLPTAFWHTLGEDPALLRDALPQSLRLVIIGGEQALPERIVEWQRQVGGWLRLLNTYGPTETTIVATAYEVPAGIDAPLHELPIGRPLPGVRCYILDPYGAPVPVGVPGELAIGGAQLARSYLNRSELTATQFVPDPFSQAPGARLYKTGDIARYRPNGEIELLGRVDQQVKVRGFRIELGEIESVVYQHPLVREAVVIVREDRPGDKRLVAYVVGQEQGSQEQGDNGEHQAGEGLAAELRVLLKERLPVYMLPSAFVMLESLPLTTSGKLDRGALPVPDAARPALEQPFVAPRTPAEELVAGVWSTVLGVPSVGAFDNFFALGGHSLLATQVIARLNTAFATDISLRTLFESPTVAELVAYIEGRQRAGAAERSTEPAPDGGAALSSLAAYIEATRWAAGTQPSPQHDDDDELYEGGEL